MVQSPLLKKDSDRFINKAKFRLTFDRPINLQNDWIQALPTDRIHDWFFRKILLSSQYKELNRLTLYLLDYIGPEKVSAIFSRHLTNVDTTKTEMEIIT